MPDNKHDEDTTKNDQSVTMDTDKKKLSVEISDEDRNALSEDMKIFFSTSSETKQRMRDFYSGRPRPYKRLTEDEAKIIIRETKITEDAIKSIHRFMQFAFSVIGRKKTTLDEFRGDIEILGSSKEQVGEFRDFFEPFIEKDQLGKTIRKEREAKSGLLTLDSVGFSYDIRAVQSEEDGEEKIEDLVPVLIVHMSFEGHEEKKEITFQLDDVDLSDFRDLLAEADSKLKKFAERISLE